MAELNNGSLARRVVLQFSFSNQNIISPWLMQQRDESAAESAQRKSGADTTPGVLLVDSMENTDVSSVLEGLETRGYFLVDACVQNRHNYQRGKQRAHGTKRYWMVRFCFEKDALAERSYYADVLREHIRPNLLALLTDALWKVRAYRNTAASGEPWMSINLEKRRPLSERPEPEGMLAITDDGPMVN